MVKVNHFNFKTERRVRSVPFLYCREASFKDATHFCKVDWSLHMGCGDQTNDEAWE